MKPLTGSKSSNMSRSASACSKQATTRCGLLWCVVQEVLKFGDDTRWSCMLCPNMVMIGSMGLD